MQRDLYNGCKTVVVVLTLALIYTAVTLIQTCFLLRLVFLSFPHCFDIVGFVMPRACSLQKACATHHQLFYFGTDGEEC